VRRNSIKFQRAHQSSARDNLDAGLVVRRSRLVSLNSFPPYFAQIVQTPGLTLILYRGDQDSSTAYLFDLVRFGDMEAFRLASRAATALRARSERCSGVMVTRDRFPPILPPSAPCFLKNSRTSGGSFFLAMAQS
jgi:hypothetical protein